MYNVSVVENKINHVFDMYNSEYAYNALKEAIASYDALSSEEKALVSNAAVLETKKAELAEKMDKTLDFSLSYSDYFPAEDNGSDDNGSGDETPNNGWVIVLIVSVSVVALAAAAAVVLILLKKKNEQKTESNDEAENA